MNVKIVLLLLIACLFQRFDNTYALASEAPDKVSSKKHSLFGKFFRKIGNKWKKSKQESAEEKFLKQVQHRNHLEEAAQIKAKKRWKKYNNAPKYKTTDVSVIQKGALKYRYRSIRKWLAKRADSKLKKLQSKHAVEEYCEYNKKAKKKKAKVEFDICEIAFKNSYFEKAKLKYKKTSPDACQDGVVFMDDPAVMDDPSKTEPIKYTTKFKTCMATDEGKDSKPEVSVYIKKSDKQKKGGRLKFFVFSVKNNYDDRDWWERFVGLWNGDNKVYKVAAYLKNSWL